MPELKERLSRILVAFDMEGNPVTVRDLGVSGAMATLLKDAIKPNLVQTIEHTPAFIHVGPFANIAHGTNSIVATRMALRLSDYVVTEAGFATDLGAEKFVDIVCRTANLKVACAVIVVTIRALKLHGGAPEKDLKVGTIEHLKNGLPNLEKHIENIRKFRIPAIIALNIFEGDRSDEIEVVKDFCASHNVGCVEVYAFEQGGAGALKLASAVIQVIEQEKSETIPIYELEDSVKKKIEKVVFEIYGADRTIFTAKAEKDILRIEKLGLGKLPICIAKTNRSLSDDPMLYGRPKNFKVTINEIRISAGAGFLVPLAGEIMLMPGLAKVPNATKIDIDADGKISGLS